MKSAWLWFRKWMPVVAIMPLLLVLLKEGNSNGVLVCLLCMGYGWLLVLMADELRMLRALLMRTSELLLKLREEILNDER